MMNMIVNIAEYIVELPKPVSSRSQRFLLFW